MADTEILFNPNEASIDKRLASLKQLYPECFDKDGAFLSEKFMQEIKAQDVDIQKEYYSLNWLGKSYGKVLRDIAPSTLLTEDLEHNQKAPNKDSQNLLIKGDNLEVLKHLKNAYKNKVKMIYIDPPYNTGSDGFVYQDDRQFSKEQLAELAGIDLEEAQRILDFTAKKSNSHSAWLTFMYPRLYIARELLKDDGVIFISIDDNEQAQLKLLCDEVFGEENFIADLPVVMNLKGNNDEFAFAGTHENALVYCRNKDNAEFNQFTISEEELDEWEKDEYGLYKKGANLKATGVNAPREKRPNLYFPIYYKDGSITLHNVEGALEIYPITNGQEMSWRWSKEKFKKQIHDVIVIENNDEVAIYKKQRPALGDIPTKKPKTLFYKPEYSSGNGTAQIKELLKEKVFQNPKPIELIKDFIILTTNQSDLILDFFAGSGTTAHAVMQLNAEDGGKRQFILVQLPEKIDEKSIAYSGGGYSTIFDITQARLEKATTKIQSEYPNYQGDLGFKIFETVDDFRTLPDYEQELSHQQTNLPLNTPYTDSQIHTLLTTWRLYDGQALSESIKPIDLAGYPAYLCDKHLYLLHPHFNHAQIKAILESIDQDRDFVLERIVMSGDAIESAKQQELRQAIKSYNNKKSLEINVLARY